MSQTLVITSQDSIGTNPFDLDVQLNSPLDLPGLWEMNMLQVDFIVPVASESLYLYTNMVAPSIIGSGNYQLLGIVYPQGSTVGQYQSYRVSFPLRPCQVFFQEITSIQMTFRNGQGLIPQPINPTDEVIVTLQIQQLSENTFLT